MTVYRYCTPEWLQFSLESYRATPRFQQELAKLTMKIFFKIKAEPSWGIEEELIFGSFLDQGALEQLAFFSEEVAIREADYILAATPQEWKRLLRKESKFVTDFMLGKVTLEQGSKVGVLAVAPHSTTLVDSLTQAELQFPDEMTAEELEEFRAYVGEFRQELGV
ncbi:MAG TPA: hypothetical protein VLY63_26315 [Anaerolineae bacterium]|nr:hypothetical protein [Anaerolineae bacterium]